MIVLTLAAPREASNATRTCSIVARPTFTGVAKVSLAIDLSWCSMRTVRQSVQVEPSLEARTERSTAKGSTAAQRRPMCVNGSFARITPEVKSPVRAPR